MRKIIITAFLKTLSPLHIAAPSSARYDPSKGVKVYSDEGVPCSTVQRLTIAGQWGKTSDERVYYPSVPVIAANNLAGRIRRRVADVYLNALTSDQGNKITISTYNAILCGAATGNPDGEPVSYDEYSRASQHPFLGIMGGGPRMMQRRAMVHNAFAYCRASSGLIDLSRVPYQDIYDNWEAILVGLSHLASVNEDRLTQIWTYRRNDDLRELVDIGRAAASIADFENAFNARQSSIIDESQNKDSSKTSTFTFQALEFVIPGTVFPLVFELNDVSDAQAGLWLRGFEAFCREERLGGMGRNGFGEFAIEHARISIFEDGELSLSEPLGSDDGFRVHAIEQWESIADQQTAAEIEYLMRLPKKEIEKAADKAKGKKATA